MKDIRVAVDARRLQHGSRVDLRLGAHAEDLKVLLGHGEARPVTVLSRGGEGGRCGEEEDEGVDEHGEHCCLLSLMCDSLEVFRVLV